MQLRTFTLSGAAAAIALLATAPAVPAITPALLAPIPSRPTPSAMPTPRGPRIYDLPFPGGHSFEVCQGNNSGETHTGLAAFAWDFCMPQGSPVTAARGGVVSMVRQDSNVGGWGMQYLNDANYIVVDHADGTSAAYLHLMHNGARVVVGQHVQTGQLLGYSGQTGMASAPHLHFMVMRTVPGDYYSQSVPVLFRDVPTNGGLPLQGQRYTSGNGAVDASLLSSNAPPPFKPFWVETFRPSSLWSGPDAKAIRFGPAATWQYLEVTGPPAGGRLPVTVASTGDPAFIPAADVGPSGPPPASGKATPGSGSSPGGGNGAHAPAATFAGSGTSYRGGAQIVVAAGDTLFGIAAEHHLTVDQLLAANHLNNANQLSIGQTLVVPQAPAPHSPVPTKPVPASNASAGRTVAVTDSGTTKESVSAPGQVAVQAGETISSIAAAHHLTVASIEQLNHLAHPNHLSIGQLIKLA